MCSTTKTLSQICIPFFYVACLPWFCLHSSSLFFHLAIKLFDLQLKLWFKSRYVVLVLCYLHSHFLFLFLQVSHLFLESVQLNWIFLPAKILSDLIGEMIIQVFCHFQFFLYDFQLIFQWLVAVLHFHILFPVTAIAFEAGHWFAFFQIFGARLMKGKWVAQNWA